MQAASFEESVYAGKKKEAGFHFKTLHETMEHLHHGDHDLDVLKFDIEGFEWDLFAEDLLKSPIRPVQLAFELHTAKANPRYVPQQIVHDKGFIEVNKLFLTLYDLGYRVVSKELNDGDPECAEFVLLNILG